MAVMEPWDTPGLSRSTRLEQRCRRSFFKEYPARKSWITPARIISYATGGSATIFTLDYDLNDAEKPQEIGDFDVTRGFGYVLPDNSFVLFGRTTKGAAIAWFASSGARTISLFDPEDHSYSINNAVLVSQNQFVAIRYNASTHVNDNGLVMDRLTVK